MVTEPGGFDPEPKVSLRSARKRRMKKWKSFCRRRAAGFGADHDLCTSMSTQPE
jgi:hypothetical protein